MPYIEQANRTRLDPFISALVYELHSTGEVNYVFTRLLTEASVFKPTCYSSINAALGVLAAVGHEFYDRLAGPYEEGKMVQNGDLPVYLPYRSACTTQAKEST